MSHALTASVGGAPWSHRGHAPPISARPCGLIARDGVLVLMVNQRLGHANPGIIMTLYAHAARKDDSAATEAIARELGDGTG